MALVVQSFGTTAVNIGSEHIVNATSGTQTLVWEVDTSSMQNADCVELYVKSRVAAGGAILGHYMATYVHAQPAPEQIKSSIPVASPYYSEFMIKQTSGTARSYAWVVLSI